VLLKDMWIGDQTKWIGKVHALDGACLGEHGCILRHMLPLAGSLCDPCSRGHKLLGLHFVLGAKTLLALHMCRASTRRAKGNGVFLVQHCASPAAIHPTHAQCCCRSSSGPAQSHPFLSLKISHMDHNLLVISKVSAARVCRCENPRLCGLSVCAS